MKNQDSFTSSSSFLQLVQAHLKDCHFDASDSLGEVKEMTSHVPSRRCRRLSDIISV